MTDNVDELKKMIDIFFQKEQAYQSEINILKEQIKKLQGQLFGRESEKNLEENPFPKLFPELRSSMIWMNLKNNANADVRRHALAKK